MHTFAWNILSTFILTVKLIYAVPYQHEKTVKKPPVPSEMDYKILQYLTSDENTHIRKEILKYLSANTDNIDYQSLKDNKAFVLKFRNDEQGIDLIDFANDFNNMRLYEECKTGKWTNRTGNLVCSKRKDARRASPTPDPGPPLIERQIKAIKEFVMTEDRYLDYFYSEATRITRTGEILDPLRKMLIYLEKPTNGEQKRIVWKCFINERAKIHDDAFQVRTTDMWYDINDLVFPLNPN